MNRQLSFLTIIILFLALTCCQTQQNQQQSTTSKAPITSQDILNRIGEVESKLCSPVKIEGVEQYFHNLAEQMEFYQVPGLSIAVINDGKIEWAKGYGLREAGTNLLINEMTLFQAASISKSVSALGALRLVEKGILDLDSNINNFLKSWKIPDNDFTKIKPVTLRYLLCHGAGVSGHALGTYLKGDEIPTYLQLLEGLPPSEVDPVRIVAEPQTEYKYSGGGYLIALQAMIDATGQSFFDIMNETVLSPAGMEMSGYFQSLEYGSVENVAVGHGGMNTVLDGYWQTMANPAGGGLWTTPTDLCLFAIEIQKALRSKSSVISRELAEEMLTSHMGNYGLGLFLHGEGENLAFSHGGGNAGYQGYFFAYAGRGQGVAVMTNSINGHYVYNEVLRSVAIVYDWLDMKPKAIKPFQIPLETLNAYKGRYLWNNALGAEITVENDHLKMEGDDGRIFLFYPESDNHFYDLYSGWDLKFILNGQKEVTGALMGMGEEAGFRAEKIDK